MATAKRKPMTADQKAIYAALSANATPLMSCHDIMDYLRERGTLLTIAQISANMGRLHRYYDAVRARTIRSGRPLVYLPIWSGGSPISVVPPSRNYWYVANRLHQVIPGPLRRPCALYERYGYYE